MTLFIHGDVFGLGPCVELNINGINFTWLDGQVQPAVFINAVQPDDDGDDYYGDGSEFYAPLEFNDYTDIDEGEECYTRTAAEHQRLCNF
jgi:hypothetical protein